MAFRKTLLFLIAFVFAINTGLPVVSDTVFLKGTAYKSGILNRSLTIGKSEVIVSNEPIRRLAITDPSVADIRILSDTSALIRGKRVGKTSLIIWEGYEDNTRPQRFDLTIKRDMSELIANLKLLDPSINVNYVIVQAPEVLSNENQKHNGAFTSSYSNMPQQVGEPAPSVVVNQAEEYPGGVQSYDNTAQEERIILTGKVKSSEVIAKAMTITMAYIGETGGQIQVVTRTGGLLKDGVANLLGSSGSGTDVLSEDVSFIANLDGNIANGSILSSTSGRVISMMEIEDQVQVAIKARFYEITKSKNKEFSAATAFRGARNVFSTGVGGSTSQLTANASDNNGLLSWVASLAASGATNGISALFDKGKLGLSIQALEQAGSAKVLAEPTIVVKNGEPGLFRVGGEIPIVTQATNATTTQSGVSEYANYGVSLSILPSMTDNDSILMNVKAINRTIDQARATTLAPAFLTKKVETQVEMDPSQALVIGGLINGDSTHNLSKIPIIGDLPVIGTLFRSKAFQRGDSELVIILSPELVRPASFAQINKPLELEGSVHDNNYFLVPDGSELGLRSSAHIKPGPLAPPNSGPVDLRRPSTLNDLDNIYR